MKVLTDKMQQQINPTPVPATIASLRALEPPVNPNRLKDTRYAPTELTVFEVTGVLVYIKSEDDEDYHLVIRDDSGRTMIVESPADNCVGKGKLAADVRAARKAIDDNVGPVTKKAKKPKVTVTVTGIGFFDPIHGQTGVAPNGIELHPLLSIDFHPDKSIGALKKRLRKKKEEDRD